MAEIGFQSSTRSPSILGSGRIEWTTVPHWMMRFRGGAFELRAEVFTDASGQDLRRSNPWEVGFIQNVLRQQIVVEYKSGRRVRETISTPALDAWGQQKPWMHPIEARRERVFAWIGLMAQGPDRSVRVQINTNDAPSMSYYNFFQGGQGHSGDEVSSILDEVTFRTWIAARPANSPSGQLSSYRLLQATEPFVLERSIRIASNSFNAVFQSAYEAVHAGNRALVPVMHADARVGIRGQIVWRPIGSRAGDRSPVVSGSVAAEVYGSRIRQRGIGPDTGRIPSAFHATKADHLGALRSTTPRT